MKGKIMRPDYFDKYRTMTPEEQEAEHKYLMNQIAKKILFHAAIKVAIVVGLHYLGRHLAKQIEGGDTN